MGVEGVHRVAGVIGADAYSGGELGQQVRVGQLELLLDEMPTGLSQSV
ncbi:hypothetical protein ACFWVT_31915 [Streptomyces cyaneofuscatus]